MMTFEEQDTPKADNGGGRGKIISSNSPLEEG